MSRVLKIMDMVKKKGESGLGFQSFEMMNVPSLQFKSLPSLNPNSEIQKKHSIAEPLEFFCIVIIFF